MSVELLNCNIVDPIANESLPSLDSNRANGTATPTVDGRESPLRSLWLEKGRVTYHPTETVTQRHDMNGAIVMAGGIDLHTHIGGGKVNLARMLMGGNASELSQRSFGEKGCIWPTDLTGQRYSQMGYTACFEPAMMLTQSRHTHLELADTPLLDTGAYVVLGNEEWLLESLGSGIEDARLNSLVAWAVRASQALAVKVVNPGGISAFKFNQRQLELDQPHPRFGVTPRDVIRRLSAAVEQIGLKHPLHVHASNLGVPGNVASTLATLQAAEGHRVHLTHAQFNCYSGPFSRDDVGYAMGSGAELLSRYVNAHTNVTLDVGQIVFGQTVTISADQAAQFRNRGHAKPRQWMLSDLECQSACGVVPMVYSDKNYVHSLQWTIGLELLLLVDDPWRIFLTTDHPNGGPFTSYPHLIRLLMDRTYRQSMLARIHPKAAEFSLLRELDREYSLEEIAIITRAAPARALGLSEYGSLAEGAVANVVAYPQSTDWEATFMNATTVFKNGQQVLRQGAWETKNVVKRYHRAEVAWDPHGLTGWRSAIEQTLRMPMASIAISDDELAEIYSLDPGSTASIWAKAGA